MNEEQPSLFSDDAAGDAGADGQAGQQAESAGAAAAGPAGRNGHKVVIIDGHALAFRSYYAIRNLSTSSGRSVNAVYGFLRSLLRILSEERDNDATIVAFDAPARTFRHEQYEDYKAGRAPTPDDLPEQIDLIRRAVDLLGLYQLEVPGLEADDIIGTLAARCSEQGYTVEIVTSDRDAYQLVSDRVIVRGLDRNDHFGPADVLEKYGVTVAQWTDYRALTGDSSDNIPGARGIGPVGARNLLQRYGTLDYILQHLDEVQPAGAAKKIRESLDDVKLSRELSQIVTDADLECDPPAWAQVEMKHDELRQLLLDLEFNSILRELGLTESVTYQDEGWNPAAEGSIGFVLSDASATQSQLEGLAVAAGRTVGVAPDATEARSYLERLGKAGKPVVAADAKALVVWAACQGITLEPGDDPLLMAYVLDPSIAQPVTAAQRFGAGEWSADAASRATVTAELLGSLPGKLTDGVRSVYEDIEKPLQRVLADMEIAGVHVDRELLVAQSELLSQQLEDLEERVRAIAEMPDMNLNSTGQVAELLYDRLGLQAGRKTSTGRRSTAISVLEGLRESHEVVNMILEYRELHKLKGTYLDPLPRLINPETGRIHTTFNQTVAATGRLSSTNPNLQNIPVRTELGRQIRSAFIAEPGHLLLAADYSQIELRVLAHIAQEPALIEAFAAGNDIHRSTAAQVHGVTLEEVTPDMRRVAKIINFGVLYGMSAHRLTRELGISYKEAELFINTYFERYPNVRRYIDSTLEECRRNGFVETLAGRRRMIPEINSADRVAREYAERTAYNMPIQGTAADIMKIAMLKLAPRLGQFDARLILQVHDELIIEVPAGRVDEVARVTRETMEQAWPLSVPLLVEVAAGENWRDAK
jgi:DNA polymerase-1